MSRTTLAAAVVVAVVALGGAFFLVQRASPRSSVRTRRPRRAPVPVSPPSPCAKRDAHRAPTPSPTPTPIIWTQASLKEDWPAPVRTEPAGGASVEPLQLRLTGGPDECGRKADPVGDTGSDAYPWVDIREFVFCGATCLGFTLVSNQPPVVHPTEQWIAYGVVTDDDGDGVADRRIGMDNIPHVADQLDYRAWTTDLHTGRTIVGWNSEAFSDSYYPPGSGIPNGRGLPLRRRKLTGGGSQEVTFPEQFYFWASVIQGGQVVATDYAPDVGWLAYIPLRKSRVRLRPVQGLLLRSRTIPMSRAGGSGRPPSSTTVPIPRRCSWPRTTGVMPWGGWSGP